jgi:hypothetical protein
MILLSCKYDRNEIEFLQGNDVDVYDYWFFFGVWPDDEGHNKSIV